VNALRAPAAGGPLRPPRAAARRRATASWSYTDRRRVGHGIVSGSRGLRRRPRRSVCAPSPG